MPGLGSKPAVISAVALGLLYLRDRMLAVRVSTRVRATSGRGRTERSILQYDERSARRRTAARSRSRRGALLKATKTASCPPDVTELVLCPSAAGTRTKRVRSRSIRTRWTQEQQWQAPSAWGPPPRHSLSRPGEFSAVCPKGGLVEHQQSA